MEPNNNQIPLVISFISLIFFNCAQAACVPRNSHNAPVSPPSSSPQASSGADAPVSYISAPTYQEYPPESASPEAEPPVSFISAPSPQEYPPESEPPTFSPGPQPFGSPPSEAPCEAPASEPPAPPSQIPSSLPTPITQIDPAIEKICRTTDSPALCVSSLAPFQNGKTDPLSVLEMAVKASTEQAKLALAKATELGTGADSSPEIQDCQDNYSDVLDNLKSAMDAIPSRDTGTINTMLSAALTDFGTCEDGLGGGSSPLSPFDDKGSKLASICLAISSLVK